MSDISVRPAQSFCLNLFAVALLVIEFTVPAKEQANFFLPQNPVAAAYILGRLSNQELVDAPRSEFVYVALVQRKGLDRKYRVEALDGLASIRHTDRLTELLRSIGELDKKGEDARDSLSDLGFLLLQSAPTEIGARREEIEPLTVQGQLPLTRQIALAALIVADDSSEPTWSKASQSPERLTDLVSAIPLLPGSALRAQFYSKIKPLLLKKDAPKLRVSAISALPDIPGYDAETFNSLAQLVLNDVEIPTAITSLERVPRSAWAGEHLKSLGAKVVGYLQKISGEQRTGTDFSTALRFGTDVAALLPETDQRELSRVLRSLGPALVTLHAVYEQMRFDKDHIVVEAAKPIVITLQNDDAMPHNLAILAPGALKEIGMAAEKMAPEPDSESRLYVPASAKILHATRLANPGQSIRLAFDAPAEPGEYPFVCTFPGHWLRMSGVLAVVKDLDTYLASHPVDQQAKFTDWKPADFSSDWAQAEVGRNWETGHELFSKLACVQCHKLGGSGSSYGPDLTDVLKRYKNDRAAVLEEILEPSKLIADRYRNINFELKNSDSVVGMVLKEDEQSITIQTGPSDLLVQVLKKSEIQRQRAQASSPMPLGLLGGLSKSEILDLLAFLASEGQASTTEHHHTAVHGQ